MTGSSTARHASPAATVKEGLFAWQKVPPLPVLCPGAKSALSIMMAVSNTTNPFLDLYSAISGRSISPSASMTVTMFFLFAHEPMGKPMALSVRRDVTVEEVLGFALWSYWKAGWLPRLDEDPNALEGKLTAVRWVMKIAKDDGKVDEDFPCKSHQSPFSRRGSLYDSKKLKRLLPLAPNRELKISKFNFDAYAVLEANSFQSSSPI
jgi:hypothetical protein